MIEKYIEMFEKKDSQGYNEIIIFYTEIVNTYLWHILVC